MTDPWPEIRARFRSGEPVAMDELVRAIATGPLPPDLADASVTIRRRRGAPRKWTEREIATVANLCQRVRFWSEIETTTPEGKCSPLPWNEIYRRVGRALDNPLQGKSVENLISRADARGGMRVFRDEDFRRILAPDPE